MKKRNKKINEDSVRVIKISKKALFEFIYEKFLDDQEIFLELNPVDVANTFAIDFNRGEFIFCAYKAEDEKGQFIEFPEEIDLEKLIVTIPDTTSTMFGNGRYKDYTKEELISLSKK